MRLPLYSQLLHDFHLESRQINLDQRGFALIKPNSVKLFPVL